VKFRTEREALLEALVNANRATSVRSALAAPALQLTLSGDELEIAGSDPDLVVEARCPAAGDDPGSAVVPARLMIDIVRSFDQGAVNVEVADDEVLVRSGRAEFSIRQPVGGAPGRLTPPDVAGTELERDLFADGLRQVVRAAMTDESRTPQLSGVLMVETERGLRLVATDSYRLAFRDLVGLRLLAAGSEVLVPARALLEVQRLLAATGSGDGNGKLHFGHTDLDAVFDLGSVKVTTRLLKGQYPPYLRLIPPSFSCSFEAGREELGTALRRVRLLVRDTKDQMTPVRITFSSDAAELMVVTPETGTALERIDGSFAGEETTISFNPTYLLDGTEAIRSETVILQLIDSGKPAMLRGSDDEDYRYLLMPVRVS
jgi:DNA polymerase-3 subunit beta